MLSSPEAMLSSPSPRNTAWMTHTRSTSLDLSPSISTVLGSPLTTDFPFPSVGNGIISGDDGASGSSSALSSSPALGYGSPRWSTIPVAPYSPPPMYAPPGAIFSLGVPGTPGMVFLGPGGGTAAGVFRDSLASRRNSRHHKASKLLERSYLQGVECLLLVEIIASIILILIYFHLYAFSEPSSPSGPINRGPAAEPSARQPSRPFLAFIPTPTSQPSTLLATSAYLCLVAAFRTGVHRIALSLDPVSGMDNLDGGKGLAVPMATLGAAVGIMHLPLLVTLRHPTIIFGVAAWGLTALLVGGILYDSLRRATNLEEACNGDLASLPEDKEMGAS
ncbi:BQ5605_C021g09273 [Microbotryum silenes-dioicae]|uniref:BQ5605_C021g09273 protein n=1 Tax=Microbotryum silenes-dioicae TaxID=796604 RepID=A0A2X0MK73_9BASI|nr:BQ5605_C021g09273 [Microbotryum silenes-dioicae]